MTAGRLTSIGASSSSMGSLMVAKIEVEEAFYAQSDKKVRWRKLKDSPYVWLKSENWATIKQRRLCKLGEALIPAVSPRSPIQ
jgi:hypothetical protein